MAVQTAIQIFQGEYIVLTFTMTPTTDITGWTIVFNVAKSAGSTAKVITNLGCTLTTPVSGIFTATLTDVVTLAIPVNSYYWDAWRIDASNERMLAYGTFQVQAAARVP
jgi:hypothetical protein